MAQRVTSADGGVDPGDGKLIFQDENLSTGVIGTLVDAAWLTSQQEEICSLVEAAGLSLDTSDNTQLRQAINSVVNLLSAATAAGFVTSFGGDASSGYIKLPAWLGGFVVQWGSGSAPTGDSDPVVFPVAFPNACFQCVTVDGGVIPQMWGCAGLTATGFNVWSMDYGGSLNGGDYRYFAVGN